MKTISADPECVADAEPVAPLESDSNSELDRSDDIIETPLAVEYETICHTAAPSSSKSKRYPSFRDLFMKPLRGRKFSSPPVPEEDCNESCHSPPVKLAKKKRKDKYAGCAGWLEKRRKSPPSVCSSDSSDLIQTACDLSTPTDDDYFPLTQLQCARCQEVEHAWPSGVTYTKRCPPESEEWLCAQCIHTLRANVVTSLSTAHDDGDTNEDAADDDNEEESLSWAVPLGTRVLRLFDLALSAVVSDPQIFTMTNLSSLRKREDLGPNGVDDMISISDLNEASLLWNLKTRYDNENIYTFTGNILVSVNPYKMFDIYGVDAVKKYENQIIGTLPPHLFAVGAAAYDRLVGRDGEPQVVIISGESGAGKTEATKLIMQYLAAVNKSSHSASNLVTEQILEASPLLESFGNATTVRNDNSSRFGKYTQIFFRNGVIAGAKITEYLLEKSRIVTHAAEERNYHVFYELLRGLRPEDKERYGLTTADNYFYLNQGGHCHSQTKNDGDDFKTLLSAMQILGFTADEQDTIFRILSSVLHLGNVYFHRKQLRHGQEGVEMGSDAEIRWVSHLLQLRVDGIVNALTTKTTEARNERVHTPLNIDQALDARDAVAKALYSSLFGWLVNRVNSIINKGERFLSINILDIFGFEDFPENSFEQMCINYANENLQFYFNKHIFKLEQLEYAKEKIQWQNISFTDNQPVISLIAKKPIGIFHLLDDESNFPKATDASFLEKCHYNHALNELYFRPRMSSMEFGVKHYAGQVWYNVDGFLDKNRDTLRPDVVDLLISSKIQMISRMFQDMKKTHESGKMVNKGDGRFITMKPRTATVAARFHDSLHALLESMSKCNPWFVRCLKPNNDKAPMRFDLPVVLEQLRYTGMLETIRIRKMGYPIRMNFTQFVERYRCFLTRRERRSLTGHAPPEKVCKMLLERETNDHYQLGTTKVFLREVLEQHLERKRLEKIRDATLVIQRYIRAYLERRRFVAMRKSAVIIQCWVRRYLARKRYLTIRRGVVRVQANYRATRQRRLYKELRAELRRRSEVERTVQEKMRLRAAQEEQERVAKATAGFNHLEIPSELAFIYSKLDDWHQMHTERNVVKVVGAVPTAHRDKKLPVDLDHHAFTKFTNIYFKSHLWGAKKEPIKTPLLPKNNEADFQESLALFKLVMRFMSDINLSGKKEIALGNYIVNKGIVNEKLRDEIYCQICNQTWKNDDETAVARGWILMANCLSAFPPSPVLFKYLLKYVSDHANDGYGALCQQKLLQSYNLDPPLARTYPPTVMEWKANRKRVNMALEARYPDDESRHAGVDSWSTAEHVSSLLVRARGLEPLESDGWTLTMTHGDEFYDLNGQDFVLDVISELETPPAFPVNKSQFLNSRAEEIIQGHKSPQPAPPSRNTRGSLADMKRGAQVQERLSRRSVLNQRYFQSDSGRSPQSKSRSLDNLLNTAVDDSELITKMGLSRSRLNERYRSMEKIKTTTKMAIQRSESQRHSDSRRPATAGGEAEWSKLGLSSSALNSRYFSQQDLKAPRSLDTDDSDSFAENEKPRRKKSTSRSGSSNLPKRRGSERATIEIEGAVAGDSSDFDYPDPTMKGADYNGRNGVSSRFIKAPFPGKKAKGGAHSSRAYIETRSSEPRDYNSKSSALSDTSETVSLTSHVRRVRVPSQSSDVDQYLDDLFMPVLDGNLDEFSDARSLVASIKGGGHKSARKSAVEYFLEEVVGSASDDDEWDELKDAAAVAALIKGGGKGINGLDAQKQGPSGDTTFQPINLNMPSSPPPIGVHGGMISPPPLLVPGLGPVYGGYPQVASPVAGGPGSLDPNGLASLQQNYSRAFIQSAVAQNIQIQQQLMAQNQALQHLLQQSAFRDGDEPDSWTVNERSGSRGPDQVPPPVLPKNRRDSASFDGPRSSFARVQPESKSSSIDSLVEPTLVSPKNSSFELSDFQGAPPPPPPPFPLEPIFGDPNAPHHLMDPYGRAKTVRIGKWRWPPPRDDDSANPNGSFFEFKMQKQQQQQQRKKSQDSQQSFEGVEWDSFEIEEEPKRTDKEMERKSQSPPVQYKSSPERHSSPVRHKESNKPPGSIGKLKISSEMRAKLELVTISHGSRAPGQPEPGNNGGSRDNDEVLGPAGVRKLEDNRRLMLQQQLAGRKWDSVEEVERITRRASSEERSDLIKAVHQRPQMDQMDRARRSSDISSSQARSSQFETAVQRSSSPPTTYYSMNESQGTTATLLPDRDRRSSASTFQTEDLRSMDHRIASLEEDFSSRALESIETKLYGPLNAPFFTYNMVPWTLHVRKEIFSPSENLGHPLALHLVFCQVVQDAYNDACLRISREDRIRMQQMLDNYGISPVNITTGHHKITLKRNVVEMARQWPLYFARLYPVSGGRPHSDVQILAVSHSGIRLVKREPGQAESLHVLQSFGFSEISHVTTPRSSTLQIALRNGNQLQFFSHKANLIRDLLHRFTNEAEKEPPEYVRAVADYVTRESSLLSFRKGDVISVVHNEQYVDKGWMFGKLDGRVGIFPVEYVEQMSRVEARKYTRQEETSSSGMGLGSSPGPHDTSAGSLEVGSTDTSRVEDPGSPTQPNDGKHSLLQFALYHFRQSPEKFEMVRNEDGSLRMTQPSENGKSKKSKGKKSKEREADWTWKEQVDMVKFTKSPIEASLLRLESADLNKLAVDCFVAIMRYMGDYPLAKGQSEVDCVYTILVGCRKHESLRDEVYCQIMKQTTNNKSSRPDSCQRGWRLFSIIAAYSNCSEILSPYLFKYLETAAYDKRRAYHGTAMVCLQNLRKTMKYGGRKNAPSIEEITAITAGRNSKRQMYRLPGGTERVINTKSTSVVQDIIEEISAVINVRSEHEMDEYSLYCIVEGETYTMPLAREEYILDVTTELQKNQQVYYLIFCRSVWHYPMRLDNALYIEIVFNQIAPDYLEGLLLVMPGEQILQDCVYDIAKVAALLHRAADLDHMPTMKETKYLLPKPALSVRDIKPPQWVNLVQSSWKEVEHFKPSQAKAQVLEVLQKWPLFGSSFFAVRRVADPAERSEHILALNKNGVHFLDVMTHETLMHYPYSEVISTRKVKSEDGLYLDMKCGNLMQQRVSRIQTDQAHEISRLIRQYITIQQRVQPSSDHEANLASR